MQEYASPNLPVISVGLPINCPLYFLSVSKASPFKSYKAIPLPSEKTSTQALGICVQAVSLYNVVTSVEFKAL